MRTALALLLFLPQAQEDETKAEVIFRAIEKLGKQGRFEQSRIEYRALAKRYPATAFGKRAERRAADNGIIFVDPVEANGPMNNRVDFLLCSDGYLYTDAEQAKWDSQAKALIQAFFEEPTFREYRPYFNTWKCFTASKESGISMKDGEKDTAFGVASSGGTYHVQPVKSMEVLGAEPIPWAEGLGVMIVKDNGGHPLETGWIIYGGDPSQLVHNWGHGFGTLGDEYTNKPGRQKTRLCNVSETPDVEKVPWAHWFKRPDLVKEYGIGVHEGGHGMPKGQWRPSPGVCSMNDGAGHPYCAVCREATVTRIYTFVSPLDESTSNDAAVLVKVKKTGENFAITDPKVLPWVLPMQPATHRLTVKWALKKDDAATAGQATGPSKPPDDSPAANDPLNKTLPEPKDTPKPRVYDQLPFEGDALGSVVRPDKRGKPVEIPDLSKTKLRPGKYLLTVDVRDETMIGKPPKPWVLKDENHWMVERRAWVLEVTE